MCVSYKLSSFVLWFSDSLYCFNLVHIEKVSSFTCKLAMVCFCVFHLHMGLRR